MEPLPDEIMTLATKILPRLESPEIERGGSVVLPADVALGLAQLLSRLTNYVSVQLVRCGEP